MIRKFLELTLPMKLLWSSVAVMIVGPGINALVSEFAAYSYALDVGIRPPLEGIPYLTAAVTLGSIALPVAAASVFLLVRFLFSAVVASMVPADEERLINKLRAKPVKESLAPTMFFATCLGFFGAALAFLAWPEDPNRFSLAATMFLVGLLLVITSVWSRAIWWLAFSSIMVFYIGVFSALFSTDLYSDFLRTLGYGGGAKVLVEHETASGDSREEDYYLLLRTSEALIALKQDKVTVIEIPIESVSSIQYALGSQSTDYVDVAKLELKSKEGSDDNVPAAPVPRAVESGV